MLADHHGWGSNQRGSRIVCRVPGDNPRRFVRVRELGTPASPVVNHPPIVAGTEMSLLLIFFSAGRGRGHKVEDKAQSKSDSAVRSLDPRAERWRSILPLALLGVLASSGWRAARTAQRRAARSLPVRDQEERVGVHAPAMLRAPSCAAIASPLPRSAMRDTRHQSHRGPCPPAARAARYARAARRTRAPRSDMIGAR